jgi:hypothetical protein
MEDRWPRESPKLSAGKKLFVSFQIWSVQSLIMMELRSDLYSMYSFSVYVGSSIYAPATEFVMHDFGIGAAPGVLPLAMYVLACEFTLTSAEDCRVPTLMKFQMVLGLWCFLL